MCGIAGILTRHSEPQLDCGFVLPLLHHRGPDDRGVWNDGHAHFAHTRLSILDLTPSGHQPMSYADGRYWIVYNGEIYNYIEIRNDLMGHGHTFRSTGDTEVLLAAYAQWGEGCVGKLRGMFAFAIWDTRLKSLFLARDRCGERPLYYWAGDTRFYFASEMKALLAMLPKTPDLCPRAIDLFFHYQYIPEPITALEGILKLQAAHSMEILVDTLTASPKRYWDINAIAPRSGDPAQCVRQQLDGAVELTLRSDVPIGIALSGGIDSSILAALAVRKYGNSLQAFSVGYPGEPRFDERNQARAFAQSLGINFFDVEIPDSDAIESFPEMVRIMDDPIGDVAAFGHYSVMKLAADHGVRVVMSGLGGDELFWGYPWVKRSVGLTIRKISLLARFPSTLLGMLPWLAAMVPYLGRLRESRKVPRKFRELFSFLGDMQFMDFGHPDQPVLQNQTGLFIDAERNGRGMYCPQFRERLDRRSAYDPILVKQLRSVKNIDISICRTMFDTWLVSNCLALSDRVSMASSVETRLPFLESGLIETVFGLRQKAKDYLEPPKSWLIAATEGLVPAEIVNRPKQGFRPPNGWVDGILRKQGDALTEGSLVKTDVFSGKRVQEMVRDRATKKSSHEILYLMALLQTWLDCVVPKRKVRE